MRLAAAAAALSALRLTGRRVGLALVYHRVSGRAGDGALELNPAVAASAFERQVAWLARVVRLVEASALPLAVAGRRRGGRIPVAITFDDDLPEHARVAAPLLRAHGAPATFFLCGAFLGGERFFWWEDLQAAVDAGALEAGDLPHVAEDDLAEALARRPRAIHRVARAIEELRPAERAEVARVLAERAGPLRDGADRLEEQDARDLAASFELGFHTRRHDLLTGLDDAGLAAALADGRAELEEAAGAPLRALAYPHGKADGRVAAAAREAGFAVGFTGRAEAFAAGGDQLLVGRVEPRAGDTLPRFAWTLARALLRA